MELDDPKSSVPAVKTANFRCIDSFRGLAACLVAFAHFDANSIIYGSQIFDSGKIYVDLFFVISGFVIFVNYDTRLRNGYGLMRFMLLRFGRLWPLHMFILLLFVTPDILRLLIPSLQSHYHFQNPPFGGEGGGWLEFFANVFLVHALGFFHKMGFNGVSWSISTEFYAYALFGLVLITFKTHYKYVVFALLLISALLLMRISADLYATLNCSFLRCCYGFATGAMTFYCYDALSKKDIQQSDAPSSFWPDTMLESCIVAITLCYIQFFSEGRASFAAPIIFGILIFTFAFEKGGLSKLLKHPFLVFIGSLSYSIYMIHPFISFKILKPFFTMLSAKGVPLLFHTTDGKVLFGTTKIAGTLIELGYLILVILCSYCLFITIERPCRDYFKRLARRNPNRRLT